MTVLRIKVSCCEPIGLAGFFNTAQEVLQIEHGSLYPALHRLEKQGWLASEWKISEANRRARYYKLTPRGKRQLIAEQSRWKLLVRSVARTMKPVKE
jgi:PadR family transcriptional regulator, regulatory protein PadR